MENLSIKLMNQPIDSSNNRNVNIKQELPVIKYNVKGELISANSAGVEFLCTIKGESLDKTVEYMVNKYPHLLKYGCATDFILTFNAHRYFFSAVSFDEAGYIGWYCYKTEVINHADVKSAA
ncbi:MAG TPA: hypothetical protein PKD91_09940 [Bacteroidia bacterium]|nr:hypothetical protein [Bacteroidia bacterium]